MSYYIIYIYVVDNSGYCIPIKYWEGDNDYGSTSDLVKHPPHLHSFPHKVPQSLRQEFTISQVMEVHLNGGLHRWQYPQTDGL